MTNPTIQSILREFRKEYKDAYAAIFEPSVLEKGNKWFEDFLESRLESFGASEYKRGLRETAIK